MEIELLDGFDERGFSHDCDRGEFWREGDGKSLLFQGRHPNVCLVGAADDEELLAVS